MVWCNEKQVIATATSMAYILNLDMQFETYSAHGNLRRRCLKPYILPSNIESQSGSITPLRFLSVANLGKVPGIPVLR